MSSQLGAGDGADILQQILRQKFTEAAQAQHAQQEQQRILLDAQRQQQQQAYQNEALKSLQDERAANGALRQQQTATDLAGKLDPGAVLDAGGAAALKAGNLGSLIQHQGATLPSTAIQGGAQAGTGLNVGDGRAPRMVGLAATENAGHGAQDVYQGTAGQQQAQAQQKALRMLAMQDPTSPIAQWVKLTGGHGAPPAELFKPQNETEDVYQTGPNGQLQKVGTVKKGSHIANAPQAAPTINFGTGQSPQDQVSSAAKAIIEGRMSPSQATTMFGGMGKDGQAFKRAVVSAVQTIDPQFNFAGAESNYQFGKNTGTQNTVRYMGSVQESIPLLLQRANTLNNGNVRSLNELVNAGKNQFNDVDVKRFQTDALLVSDEVAKILQGGGTGSGTSDAKLKQAAQILSTSDSPQAIAAALGDVNQLIGFRKDSLTKGTFMEHKDGAAPKDPLGIR